MKPLRPWIAVLLLFAAALADAPAPPAKASQPALLPPLVFASRHPVRDEDGRIDVWAIPGIGPRDRTAAVGGRLLVRDPGGSVRVLVGSPSLFDVADPDVSYDGRRIVFSGLAHPDSSWRIYVVESDGTGLHAVTRSDRDIALVQFGPAAPHLRRYDDIDPCWLPDGRIVFASTRFPAIAQAGGRQATNLFVLEADGTVLHRITTDRNGAEEPCVDPITGRIVYSRWLLNVDRPSHVSPSGVTVLDAEALTQDVGNVWQCLSITPDGREARLHAGDPRTRAGFIAYKPSLLRDGRTLVVRSANGSFVPSPVGTGIRLYEVGADPGSHVIGLQLSDAGVALPVPPFACDPVELPDGRLLASYLADEGADWGLVVCDVSGANVTPILDLPGTLELDAAPLVPRSVPPVLEDQHEPFAATLPPTADPATFLERGTFRLDCLNVYTNAPVDAPIPDAPPITPGARARLFMSFQRQSPVGRDAPILFREGPLSARGAIYEQGIPADVPLFDQILDAGGKVVVGADGTPAHLSGMNFGRQSGWAQCVGCHAGHSLIEIPNSFADAEWFNASTSARVHATSSWQPAGEASTAFDAQRLVDRRARSGGLEAAWVAAGHSGESVVLEWPVPIEVRSFVLYGIALDASRDTDVRVENCRITLWRTGQVVGLLERTGRIDPFGTRVEVEPAIVDAVRFEILTVRGRVAGVRRAGLAEVETLARIALE